MLVFLQDVEDGVEEVATAASEQTLKLTNEEHNRTTLSLERAPRAYESASNHAPDESFVKDSWRRCGL